MTPRSPWRGRLPLARPLGAGPCKPMSCFPGAGLREPDAHSRAAEENAAEGLPRHLGWDSGVLREDDVAARSPAAVPHAAGSLPLTTPGNSQDPTPERHGPHTSYSISGCLFFFFPPLFAFCFHQGRGSVELASSQDCQFPLDSCWEGRKVFLNDY